MAISPTTIITAILSAGSSDLKGSSFPKLAKAIGEAVFSWATVPSNLSLSGVTTGQSGAGVVLGNLTIPILTPTMVASMSGSGLNGPTMPLLAKVISIGISTSFSTAQYSGASVGVAIGSDISKISSVNTPTLTIALSAALSANLGNLTANITRLATGISLGISSQLLAGGGIGVVTGTPSPIPTPSVGTSPYSKVF